jgi:nucleoside-diphosphate-sugar epimerase
MRNQIRSISNWQCSPAVVLDKFRYKNSRKILVTGGAGFLGSHLCDKLLRDGHSVVCVDNFQTGLERNVAELARSERAMLIRHDITAPLTADADEIYNLAPARHLRRITNRTQSARQ